MNYQIIKYADVANGVGVRVSLFVSGCDHGCAGCFNPESWRYDSGEPFTPAVAEHLLQAVEKPYIRGLSLLGGEPLAPKNQETILALLHAFHQRCPQKSVWCYSGYLFEDLLAGRIGVHDQELLSQMDILVDGPFVQEKKNLSLPFCGSENQRIIRLTPSLSEKKICLWER